MGIFCCKCTLDCLHTVSSFSGLFLQEHSLNSTYPTWLRIQYWIGEGSANPAQRMSNRSPIFIRISGGGLMMKAGGSATFWWFWASKFGINDSRATMTCISNGSPLPSELNTSQAYSPESSAETFTRSRESWNSVYSSSWSHLTLFLLSHPSI